MEGSTSIRACFSTHNGARFLKHFVMMGTQQLCLRALFCFQPFPQPCLNQHKNLVKQQLAFDFSEIVCSVGEGYKSPMDPEMNMKSQLLQRTAAFEAHVLKHVKYWVPFIFSLNGKITYLDIF